MKLTQGGKTLKKLNTFSYNILDATFLKQQRFSNNSKDKL